MQITKKTWLTIIVVGFLVLLAGIFYKVLTYRHHPPSKGMQRNALSMLQSQDDEQIYQGLRLLSIFQPAEGLRDNTERHLSHENPDIQMKAIFLIGMYRDVQAGISLTAMLDDADSEVAEAAKRGLHKINNSLGLPFDYQHFEP